MAYASWSVVFGEQPSAAKWNILGTNDSSFNDGTGISALTIGATTAVRNSYKFSVYRNAALTPSGTAVLTCDTKEFDTGTNVDVVTNKGRFTAPIAGFYWFASQATTAGAVRTLMMLYKNGSEAKRGTDFNGGGGGTSGQVSAILSLAANDYVEVYVNNGSSALTVGAATYNYFQGFLISAT